MKLSLRTRLSLSFISITLVCVLLITVLTNLMLDRHFKDYIKQNQARKNNDIVMLLGRQYIPDLEAESGAEGNPEDRRPQSSWNTDAIEDICINSLEQGMIIKLTDLDKNVIWDARLHDNERCQDMISHMEHNMKSRYPNWNGGYVVDSYPVSYGLKAVGTVEIGYYGPFYYTDDDLAFINKMNGLLAIAALFSLILSLIIASLIAGRISTPISRVTATAEMISKGYFGDRADEKTNTKEISQLTETINNLAETLENQEALRKRMTADVAHELRTPLATLQSHMEAMIDGIWEPDTERLQSCHDEILRINRLVGDLEKLARYENENLILIKTEFDIMELVRQIQNNFQADFINKNIELRLTGESEIVFADRDKISQVFVNLLSNAYKYTPPGGSVEVTINGSKDTVEICIKDTGYGIHHEDLPHIFERFYRADRSRNRQTGGAGIGLAITKAIIDAHKGSIQVKSEVNAGTEFRIILPR